mgnify:CR=1 FL=1
MKYHHLLTLLTAAGILLPAQQATAFTSPLPELADGISLAPKKNKKGKKGKKKKKTADKSVKALAKKIFNATDEQKQKAKAFLKQQGNPLIKRALREGNDKVVYASLMTASDEQIDIGYIFRFCLEEGIPQYAKLLIASGKMDVNKYWRSQTLLQEAALRGRAEFVELLLATPGVDVNAAEEEYGWTALHWAAKNDHPECVKLLLAAPGIDINKADKDGKTPLYRAAYYNNTECTKLLVAAPEFDESTWEPLPLAVMKNDVNTVKKLIKEGADVNKGDAVGKSPLHWAAELNHIECAKILVATQGINVNITEVYGDAKTPVQRAAFNGHAECLKLLLAQPGVDVNQKQIALIFAAENGHAECVKLLLAVPGIDVNAYKLSTTAIIAAAKENHPECVKLLLAVPGIDVNIKDSDGKTALYKAAEYNRTECTKLLLAAPGFDESTWEPLPLAVMKNDVNTVKKLIKEGADVNKGDAVGKSPLHWAAELNHIECAKILVATQGINVNITEVYGDAKTPVQRAAFNGHAECLKLLLAQPGVDVNQTAYKEETALIFAAKNGHAECVKLLLAAPGVDINKTDKNYVTALGYASLKGYTECKKLLREAAATGAE